MEKGAVALPKEEPIRLLLLHFGESKPVEEILTALVRDKDLAEQTKDSAIFAMLRRQNHRTWDEAVLFFHWLHIVAGMELCADRMQQLTLEKRSSEVKNLVFKLWLVPGWTPRDVFHMMPFASEVRNKPQKLWSRFRKQLERLRCGGMPCALARGNKSPRDWVFFCKDLEQWLRYVDFYNARGIRFGADEVACLLKEKVSNHELKYLSGYFRTQSRRTEFADQLLLNI